MSYTYIYGLRSMQRRSFRLWDPQYKVKTVVWPSHLSYRSPILVGPSLYYRETPPNCLVLFALHLCLIGPIMMYGKEVMAWNHLECGWTALDKPSYGNPIHFSFFFLDKSTLSVPGICQCCYGWKGKKVTHTFWIISWRSIYPKRLWRIWHAFNWLVLFIYESCLCNIGRWLNTIYFSLFVHGTL